MNSFIVSMQAMGAATSSLLALQSAHRMAPGLVPMQEGVRALCLAIRQLQTHVKIPKVPKVKALPPPTLIALPPIPDPSPMRVDHPLATQEINGCKALLLEIIRRASYDWVLYRTSERMQFKKLAEDAFYWLFVEEPGHPNWIERSMNQKSITSFVAICEALDLDPDAVRKHVRKLTVKNVMSVGRPAEYRWNVRQEEATSTLSTYEERSLPPESSFFEEELHTSD